MRTTRTIQFKEARPARFGSTFFRLPGELRNDVYSVVLGADHEQVPHHAVSPIVRNNNFALLQASSQIYYEARGMLTNLTLAYVPVMRGVEYDCNGFKSLEPICESTITRALQEFVNVHFHVHLDSDYREEFLVKKDVLDPLYKALMVFMKHSQDVSKKHQWRRRRGILHLDHFIYWITWINGNYPIGVYRDLVDLIKADTNTKWEIRFYVATGTQQIPEDSVYWQADLAELKAYCKDHEHIDVIAEVYGERRWAIEDTLPEVTRDIMKCSPIWPSVQTTLPTRL